MDDKRTTEDRVFEAAAQHGRDMTRIAREADQLRRRQERAAKGKSK